MTDQRLEHVLAYHDATKHHLGRYARGPGYLDWDTQPDPFLRFHGAPLIALDHAEPGAEPRPPRAVDRSSVSQLFEDSLALSAWKEAGGSRWALRVNPSSGNLHPTEGYLVCGPVAGLCEAPMVAHYAPREHALERRAAFDFDIWAELVAELPAPALIVGLTSIHWREAWKYGERGFRYCQHDVGHAIAALGVAAAALGWQATLLDDLPTRAVATLLGVAGREGVEAEAADCVIAVHPAGAPCPGGLPEAAIDKFAALPWIGEPGPLSPDHVEWSIIDQVARASVKPPGGGALGEASGAPLALGDDPVAIRRLVRQRRSAVAFDGHSGITEGALYEILQKTRESALPWSPRVDLALFVHRVQGLVPGLYFLLRDPARRDALREAMDDGFEWAVPGACPDDLDLFRLAEGDARALAQRVSCHQEIAADGCFALGMIADFESSVRGVGPWVYPRLFWECGVIGQVLYLQAEALGIRGTGIGCFFDDAMHRVLGFEGARFQSLYHFTLGGPVDDPRLRTLAPYG